MSKALFINNEKQIKRPRIFLFKICKLLIFVDNDHKQDRWEREMSSSIQIKIDN